jgi:hypothetical protein
VRRGWGGSWGAEGGVGVTYLGEGGVRRSGMPDRAVPTLGSVLAWVRLVARAAQFRQGGRLVCQG